MSKAPPPDQPPPIVFEGDAPTPTGEGKMICPNCFTRTDADICPKDGYQTVEEKHYKLGDKDPLLNTVINKRYKVLKLIGKGGMATVYKGVHLAMKRTVAIKVLFKELAQDLNAVRRFHQEALATSKLEHPNSIRVYDFGQMEDGNLFLVMEFLKGRPLSTVIEDEGPIAWKRVCHIMVQVLKALAEAHAIGIIHRDLKPANIFLRDIYGEKDFAKVLDFGIAKMLEEKSVAVTLTHVGFVVGSPRYMSPEQIKARPLDGRSDLYSCGLLMYEMLTKSSPIRSTTTASILVEQLQKTPPSLLTFKHLRDVPKTLDDLIFRMLQKNRKNRPESAESIISEIERIVTMSEAPVGVAPVDDGQATRLLDPTPSKTINESSTSEYPKPAHAPSGAGLEIVFDEETTTNEESPASISDERTRQVTSLLDNQHPILEPRRTTSGPFAHLEEDERPTELGSSQSFSYVRPKKSPVKGIMIALAILIVLAGSAFAALKLSPGLRQAIGLEDPIDATFPGAVASLPSGLTAWGQEVQALIDEKIEAAKPAPVVEKVTIQIVSDPPEADVIRMGKVIGKTPMSLPEKKGAPDEMLTFMLEEHLPTVEKVSFTKDDTLSVTLEPKVKKKTYTYKGSTKKKPNAGSSTTKKKDPKPPKEDKAPEKIEML